MSRVPIHDHSNIHQGGKIRASLSISGADLTSGSGSSGADGGGGSGPVAAEDVTYDNGTSGLTATDVQAAIDEVVATGGVTEITDIPTSETDTSLVLHPDGVGGVEWGTDATGGGGGGALVLLESHTASASSTLDFTTCISSTYDDYWIEVVDPRPSTSGDNLLMRVGTGGGPTYDTGANYTWARFSFDATGTGVTGSNGDTSILLIPRLIGGGNHSARATYQFSNPNASLYKYLTGQSSSTDNSGTDPLGTLTRAAYHSTTAVTALRFYMSTGNFGSGTIYIYGVTKS